MVIFSRGDGPIYSWDNLQDDGLRVVAQLDRFYSFSDLVQNPSSHIMHYKILWDSSFFYHHLVFLLVNLGTSPPHGSCWKVNARFLQEAIDSIEASWEASPPQMPFFTNKKLRDLLNIINKFVSQELSRTGWKRLDWENPLNFGKLSFT